MPLRTSYQMSGTCGRGDLVLQIDEQGRLAGAGLAADVVDLGNFLDLALQPLGHLRQRVVDARAGPDGVHDHRLDRDRRIFVAAEMDEGGDAGHHDRDHPVDDERAMPERPGREIEAVHCVAIRRRRTFWPGCSACTPAVTTISPVSMPLRDDRPSPDHGARSRHCAATPSAPPDRRPRPPDSVRTSSARSPGSP